MYHENSIEQLSKNQVSKLLNGHKVRIKHGRHHKIHLSEEHSKKLHKAHMKGMGITVQLDPYAIEHNQFLRQAVGMRGKGTGTDFGHVLGHVGGEVAEASGTRLVDAIAGTDSSGNQGAYDNSMDESTSTTGGKLRRGRMHGGNVNRINKFNRWTGALGHAYQGIAHAVKPVAQPIFQAGTQRAVNYINPSPMSMMGMGMKKRGRPRKMHGGYVPRDERTGGTPYTTPIPESSYTGNGIKRRGRPRKMLGGTVNRINKFDRWTGALGGAYQGIAHAVKPVAQPILQAGTHRVVGYLNPTTPQDYLNNAIGMGLKKRGRPRKHHTHGGAAGPGGSYGY